MANKSLDVLSTISIEDFIESKYNKKAYLIVLIGLDGVGKSTQIKYIQDIITKNNYSVFTPINESLKPYKALFEKISLEAGYDNRLDLLGLETDQLLISLIKWNSMVKIANALDKENTFIVMDRYTYCFIASAKCRGAKNESLINRMFEFFPKPDLTLFLDVPPKEAFNRINKRGTDSMELSFLEKHYSAYMDLQEAKNFEFIDGTKSIEEVRLEIYKRINLYFPFIKI